MAFSNVCCKRYSWIKLFLEYLISWVVDIALWLVTLAKFFLGGCFRVENVFLRGGTKIKNSSENGSFLPPFHALYETQIHSYLFIIWHGNRRKVRNSFQLVVPMCSQDSWCYHFPRQPPLYSSVFTMWHWYYFASSQSSRRNWLTLFTQDTKCRRQPKIVPTFKKKKKLEFKFSLPNLDSACKMHSNEYKQA